MFLEQSADDKKLSEADIKFPNFRKYPIGFEMSSVEERNSRERTPKLDQNV